jgi:hypothetical protein
MKRKFLLVTSAVQCILVLVVCFDAAGQTSQPQQTPGRAAIQQLKDSIKIYNDELSLLQHLLEASTVDARILQHSKIKSWVVGNPELRDSLFYALMEVDSSIQSEAGADAEVLATEANDLVQVRFGTAVFKGLTLKDALAKSGDSRLYQKVVESYRYSKDIELRNPAFKLPTQFEPELISSEKLLADFTPLTLISNPHPVNGRFDISLYGLAFKIGPTWGGEVKIGNDEIGFPFWSSGKMALMATYKRVKFGFELPFEPGRFQSELFPPFTLKGRKLNGSRGVVGELDLGVFGGGFSVSRITLDDRSALTDPKDFAYVSGILQAYYSFGISLDPTNLVRVKVGAGVHRVNEASIRKVPLDSSNTRFDEIVAQGAQSHFVSPYLKLEYLNKDATDRYSGSFQYYDMTLVVTAAMDIIRNVLSVELKYAWPISPDLKKWQNPSFIIVSPRLRISY